MFLCRPPCCREIFCQEHYYSLRNYFFDSKKKTDYGRRQFFKMYMQWYSFTPRKTLNDINLASLQLFSGACHGAMLHCIRTKKSSKLLFWWRYRLKCFEIMLISLRCILLRRISTPVFLTVQYGSERCLLFSGNFFDRCTVHFSRAQNKTDRNDSKNKKS